MECSRKHKEEDDHDEQGKEEEEVISKAPSGHLICASSGADHGGKASKNAATAASAGDKAKWRDHGKDGTQGYTFVPCSIEAYGRLGVEADKVLKDTANEATGTGVWEKVVFLYWTGGENH
jgi:hypothetical protein